MRLSTFSLLRSAMLVTLLSTSATLFAQETFFGNYRLQPVMVNMSITNIEGRKTVNVSRDTATKGANIPSFVRLVNTDNFTNGTIEVMLLSRLLPNAGASARGFIGIAFRINKDNSRFECMYIRPTNGRADDQVRETIPHNIFPILIIPSTDCEKKKPKNMNPMPTWDLMNGSK